MANDIEQTDEGNDENERNGDFVSVLYVLGGIPAMIAFLVLLFVLTGSCDQSNIMFHA